MLLWSRLFAAIKSGNLQTPHELHEGNKIHQFYLLHFRSKDESSVEIAEFLLTQT